MKEKRNFGLVLFLAIGGLWALVAWIFLDPETAPLFWVQRTGSALLAISAAGWLLYAFRFEDKLPDHLGAVVGDVYYEADGISFMPIIRVHQGRPEICVYYQNRYENLVEAIVHLRPRHGDFEIHEGWRDVHFAFRADGGDFGVIHLPIAVPDGLRGEVIDFELAAASWYPRSHGARWRKQPGIPCGSLLVDWGGAAFKTGVHEVSGEIELIRPVTLHLSMPTIVEPVEPVERVADTWRQERLHGIGA